MNIRITGTEEELEVAKDYYQSLSKEDYVKTITISDFYPNRNSNNQYRLYVEIEYKDLINKTTKELTL